MTEKMQINGQLDLFDAEVLLIETFKTPFQSQIYKYMN